MLLAADMEVQDMARLLVVPSSRRPIPAAELAAFNARLAPIEMAAPSLHLLPPASGKVGGCKSGPQANPSPDTPAPDSVRKSPPYLISACYIGVGLVLCLCNVLVPDGLVTCMHLLCPVWTLGLAFQSLAEPDRAWAWLGWLTILLLPIVLLLHDVLFLGFYLAVFTVFASGRFWQILHGPAFVLVCVCWFGLAAACASGAFVQHPRAQLCVAISFALAAAIVSSAVRFGRVNLELS